MIWCTVWNVLCPPTFVALNNPQYKVPPHLIQMAQEENAKLQRMRYRNTRIFKCYYTSLLRSSTNIFCMNKLTISTYDIMIEISFWGETVFLLSVNIISVSARSLKQLTTLWSYISTWRPITVSQMEHCSQSAKRRTRAFLWALTVERQWEIFD